ncbi:hypothetical protein MWU60_17745 [Yoonia sp. F2084L]|uniref:hypothetical protein n=1 Tax=Yoonia sp. F2084L TaxID=2926419 RepID=UPI001FF5F77C|nr:hypothetical protein [Yoonia sp. F2084L]MCK0097424.1 hypothetical protein [Yoonia sp. F2084L]
MSNRLEEIVFSTGGLRQLTYDAAGNVTFDNRNGPGYSYNYDAANRMSSFAINGVIQAEYAYNALGQQVIRRLTQAGQPPRSERPLFEHGTKDLLRTESHELEIEFVPSGL